MDKIVDILLNGCDDKTVNHQNDVSEKSVDIANAMCLSAEIVNNVRIIGKVHDIGKICFSRELSKNTDKLTDLELFEVRRHPKVGFDILDGLGFSKVIQESVLQHHERIDGSGYPNGLFGIDIHIEAKIVAVADVVSAMTGKRPYNPDSLTLIDAINEIAINQGRFFDSMVVSAFLGIYSNIACYPSFTTTNRSYSCRQSC